MCPPISKPLMNSNINFINRVDDLVDAEDYRKGKPASHILYGVPTTVNSSIFNFFRVQHEIMKLTNNNIPTLNTFIDLMIEGYRAECYDKVWIEKFHYPNEIELNENIVRKTSFLYLVAVELMQLFSSNKTDFCYFVKLFGCFLQHRDDYECLFMPENYHKGRETFAKDLEGLRFSLPIVHAIKIKKNQEFTGKVLQLQTKFFLNDLKIFFAELFRQKATKIEDKRRCIEILTEIGSKKYCHTYLEELYQEIGKEAAKIGPNPIFKIIFQKFKIWDESKLSEVNNEYML
jgi:geranylgeranyl pyrophosphate synthase